LNAGWPANRRLALMLGGSENPDRVHYVGGPTRPAFCGPSAGR